MVQSSAGKVDIDSKAMLALSPPPQGPVVMLNLFRLKDSTQFAEYQKALIGVAAKGFAASGGESLYSGMVHGEFLSGEAYWHAMALVRYPDWSSLCAIVVDGALLDDLNLVRRAYLEDARFILTTL